ncbi:MAG: U32 family peptidase [Nanoarchaeota archaeon]|nr:U32 family peptidase [Nanoarchaeota archaeon]MBU4456561.1 U32 family peptidase [Nanoarchaeota archaeon]MCG2719932.1 U32 family peptidase [Nanoarchaeota archaeon]
MVELMCPAGSFEALRAAIKAGADSVYFGVGNLHMRSVAAKFKVDDLKEIVDICNEANVKSYLTLNAVMYDEDLGAMKKLCDLAKENEVTAIIASDLAVIQYANSIGLEVHMSTQTNISNIEAVKFYSKFAEVIVLARELSLEQIKNICDKIKEDNIKGPKGELVKIEVFVHGALCVSISGKCYMSLATYGKSANRGACIQNCRRKYRVTDDETGKELIVDNQYVMSPKDLCTIQIIDKLIEAGINVFKIEGRARGEEYVYLVTKVYKEAIEAAENKTYTKDKIENWIKELRSVFNRGFWMDGYYLGNKLGEWSNVYGSKATKEKVEVGKVLNYFEKVKAAHVKILANEINVNDELMISGKKTGIVFTKVEKILKNDKELAKATKGEDVTIEVLEKVRENDKVFLIKDRN